MAGGGAAPPSEAMRAGKGVSGVLTIVIAIVTFLAGLGAGAFFLAPAPPAGPGAILVLGTNTPFPPFEYVNSTTSVLEGFDIELIQLMVQRAGYGFTWKDFRSFDVLLAAVAVEGVDVAVGAITQNGATGLARNASMDFTDPYYEADQGVLRRTGDTRNYCAAADCVASELDLTGLRVAAQSVTTSEFWIADNLPNVTVSLFVDVTQVLLALSSGNVDIVIIDKPAADGIAARSPTVFAVEGTIQTNELYGFAVPDGDPDGLLPKLNAALRAFRADGTYARLIDKWF